MSQQYDDELRGTLWKNDRKENDRHPDYKGRAQIDGQTYWLAAWLRTPKRGGDKFLSISLEKAEDRGQGGGHGGGERYERGIRQDARGGHSLDLSDDIPFAPW